MPLYEYVCPVCKTKFEELVSIIAEQPPTCPSCGEAKASRIMSACHCHQTGGNAQPISYTPISMPSSDYGCGHSGFS
ncbi:Zinc ribbon domain-containing protein [Desulfovibrionales bacterium]